MQLLSGAASKGSEDNSQSSQQPPQRFDLMSLLGANQQPQQQTQFSQQPPQMKPAQRFDLTSLFR